MINRNFLVEFLNCYSLFELGIKLRVKETNGEKN